MKKNSYYLVSLGCAKNTVDSDSMAVLLERQLHAIATGQVADGQLGHAVVQRFGVKGVVGRRGIEEGLEIDGVAVGPGR